MTPREAKAISCWWWIPGPSVYSTRMRGGYLRFQAQYLRRIRLPYWQGVDETLKNALREAANSRDIAACNAAVFEFYGLSKDEQAVAI